MANSKKVFVDIDLQGNGLNNSTVGANADMTKAGSFQYATVDNRLEYFDNTEVQQVANLNDIAALYFENTYPSSDWSFVGPPINAYAIDVIHNLGTNTPKVACFISDPFLGGTELVEFNVNAGNDPSFCTLFSNIAPSFNVIVGVSK